MNKALRKNKTKTSKRKAKRSAWDKFLNHLKKEYGAEWDSSKSGFRSMLIVYPSTGKLPPRMPNPKGPLSQAAMSIVQIVNTYNHSSGISSDTIYQSSSTESLGSLAFELRDLDQISTLSALFDQYRIDRVHVRISTKSQNVNLAGIASPNQAYPTMFVVVDYDDGSAPGSVSELRQYSSCVTVPPGSSVDLVIEPSVTKAVYASGAFSGYSVESSADQWLDIASTAIPHYGLKYGCSGLQVSSTYSYQWTVESWYCVSFRNVR